MSNLYNTAFVKNKNYIYAFVYVVTHTKNSMGRYTKPFTILTK